MKARMAALIQNRGALKSTACGIVQGACSSIVPASARIARSAERKERCRRGPPCQHGKRKHVGTVRIGTNAGIRTEQTCRSGSCSTGVKRQSQGENEAVTSFANDICDNNWERYLFCIPKGGIASSIHIPSSRQAVLRPAFLLSRCAAAKPRRG